ncbi:MAG: GNAT family N-acetyltransferase [Calditrichaeota bacterium]|nr:GNAT family N-acetyltransferase [Calditrichota bacterium]
MSLSVISVRSRREEKAFLQFPFQLYRREPAFVPPLLDDLRRLFDPARNPFYGHAVIEMFLALWNGNIVGRIAAVVDHNYIEARRELVGSLGYFVAVNDLDVAHALFNSASHWLRKRDIRKMLGPFSPSLNDERGVLIDNFDRPPLLGLPWNPPYYQALYENSVFHKVLDLASYTTSLADLTASIPSGSSESHHKHNITIRRLNVKRVPGEWETLRETYEHSRAGRWDAVPRSAMEFKAAAKIRRLVEPGLSFIAEQNGVGIGVLLASPDLNVALHRVRRRGFPFGMLNMVWQRRKVRRIRIEYLGVVEEWRRRGVGRALLAGLVEEGRKRNFTEIATAGIADYDQAALHLLSKAGATSIGTYRIYERDV